MIHAALVSVKKLFRNPCPSLDSFAKGREFKRGEVPLKVTLLHLLQRITG